ncbi:MAG TPA: RNA polymerase sigma factor [Candidatus Polarisedimenticolia bacterium]|nr:RNA polymerase sigma factor [Candidatus Polarisedimenticolia bacterium]
MSHVTDSAATRPISDEIVKTLVANHRRFLAFVERRVGSREVAEDIVQNAFVRGLEGNSRLRDEDSAVAWFYRMLRNALIDHWRRRSAEQRAAERLAEQEEETVPAADQELMDTVCACVGDLLQTLKPEYAEALRRVDLDDKSVKEFAEGAGISANNASVRLFRGREALRQQVRRACGTCADHGCLDCRCGRPSRSV